MQTIAVLRPWEIHGKSWEMSHNKRKISVGEVLVRCWFGVAEERGRREGERSHLMVRTAKWTSGLSDGYCHPRFSREWRNW